MRWLALLVALGGCSTKLAWSEQTVTTVQVGPFTAPIPAGWRDLSDVADKDLRERELQRLPAGSRMITATHEVNGFYANILVAWLPVTGEAALPCEQLAAQATQGGTVNANAATSSAAGDKVCTWVATRGSAAGTALVRFHGDHQLVVTCLHAASGDPEAERACATVTAALAPS